MMKQYSMFVDRKTQYCQMSVLLKLTYGFSVISVKIQANYFADAKKKDSKVYMER